MTLPANKKRSSANLARANGIWCAYDKLVLVRHLKENPANPNTHPPDQIALLARIIAGQGWRNPIVVSKRSGFITKGHARLQAARALSLKQVPVDYQDYANEKQELADMVADNRIAELAEMDRGMLREIIEQLDDGAFDMDLTGFNADALEELMTATAPESDIDAEPQIDKADELRQKWGVKRGQIWELGEHRLMCGDATSNDVSNILNGDVPFLCVTDPPYGVNYNPQWRSDAAKDGHLAYAASRVGRVSNDDRSDWRAAWERFAGDVIYSWHPAGAPSLVHAAALQDSGFVIRIQIIWAKSNFPIGRGDYHVRHEPCWYAVRKGKKANRTEDRTQTTLWEINLDKNVAGGHSTQKPMECMARPIRNHNCEMVYDPFLGSGTTIMACENLHRRCRAMEIDPGYAAVSLQRWADATGKIPHLLK
jgi:DNA modification methylase